MDCCSLAGYNLRRSVVFRMTRVNITYDWSLHCSTNLEMVTQENVFVIIFGHYKKQNSKKMMAILSIRYFKYAQCIWEEMLKK